MSLIVSGPVLDALKLGEGEGGEVAVDVFGGERFCRRERRAERTGRMSIESGERPSGSDRAGSGCGVDCKGGDVLFAM